MKNEKTKIEFDYGTEHFVLEFTAASVKKMDENGFDISSIGQHILTAGEKLFSGAFLANHRFVPENKRMAIYKALTRTADGEDATYDENNEEVDALTSTLTDMFIEAVEEINGRGGNVAWRVTK